MTTKRKPVYTHTPEAYKQHGHMAQAKLRRKYRTELMNEILKAHDSGELKSIDQLIVAFAKEIISS